jgi:predicted metalloprotease with PDZ domain
MRFDSMRRSLFQAGRPSTSLGMRLGARLFAAVVIALCGGASPALAAAPRAAIVHTIRVPAPETQVAEIEMRVPTEGRAAIELMMPVWTPGFYRIEDYAGNLENLMARAPSGGALSVEYPAPNRWRVETQGASEVIVSYRLTCTGRSVTTNWVDARFGVFNGAATFLTLVESAPGPRPHDIVLELPAVWPKAMTALDEVAGRGGSGADARIRRYRAADFDTLVDSPIVAGDLDVQTFPVAGKPHALVSAGERPAWDSAHAAHDLARVIGENQRLWGALPYDRYVFLIVFRKAGPARIGGGLEHKSSTLVNASAENASTPRGYAGWLSLVTHEYVHAFNVKRLRPVELGPFDYEKPPRTSSLWFSEGVTSYYAAVLLARAGVSGRDEFLGSMSSAIGQLQNAPGRLLQTLEESSLDVWNNSLSGVNPSEKTVSYYVKGEVAGLLLDARVRRATRDRKSLDDVMRLAYRRYGGERGFTGEELRATAFEVAGVDLSDWFRRTLASTEELDYAELLDWYGLRLTKSPEPEGSRDVWKLEAREDATPDQQAHLRWLLAGSRAAAATSR